MVYVLGGFLAEDFNVRLATVGRSSIILK